MSEALVAYMSPSAMAAYLTNPMYFKKRYILKQYDNDYSVTGVIGKAGHKALERIYSGMSVDEAIRDGQREIDNMSDMEIKYNSTVKDRAALIAGYTRAIGFYVDELPHYHKIISVEEAIKEEAESMLHPGSKLPTPLSTRLDLLVANPAQEIEIIDHKFSYNYTNPEIDDFKRWLQAMFYFYAVKARYGVAPARMRFVECKTSKNKDNSPQIRDWVFEYGEQRDFAVFERLFTDVMLDMNNPGRLFLPNPGDMFNGQDMFELYRQDIMPVDAPIVMKHRTEQADIVEKHYTASVGQTVDTSSYTPEEKIRAKLQEFGIPVEMQETHVGASVTQYTLKPSRGVSMGKVAKVGNDIAIALGARSVRIEAPIRGTTLVGIEVPSEKRERIDLTDKHLKIGTLSVPVGVNVYGELIRKDLAEMPHLLIAGATGSGKSVMLNTLINSLTKQMTPDAMKLVLIDPKRVELAPFRKLPHLAFDVISEPSEAVAALDMMVDEMEQRYNILEKAGARGIDEYKGNMPKIVVIIDEFADLMMNGGTEKRVTKVIDGYGPRGGEQSHKEEKPSIETQIVRIAQKARAVGIHLVLATQRPSADVVTGLIKANIPTKICFMTTSRTNSQIVLDAIGAEELTGKGDMLMLDPHTPGLTRLQGLYS